MCRDTSPLQRAGKYRKIVGENTHLLQRVQKLQGAQSARWATEAFQADYYVVLRSLVRIVEEATVDQDHSKSHISTFLSVQNPPQTAEVQG